MKHSLLLQLGYGFIGFSFAQFLAFLGAAYPMLANGCTLFLLLMWLAVIVAGIAHWLTLLKQGYQGENHILIGFMPVWILGGFLTIAIFAGISLAGVSFWSVLS